MTSQISGSAFAQALRSSVEKSGLFAKVADPATYKLDAYIANVVQLFFGFDMKVDMQVDYTLVDTRTGKRVVSKVLHSSHTATTGDSVVGVDQLRLANEGAARADIRSFLQEVSQLKHD